MQTKVMLKIALDVNETFSGTEDQEKEIELQLIKGNFEYPNTHCDDGVEWVVLSRVVRFEPGEESNEALRLSIADMLSRYPNAQGHVVATRWGTDDGRVARIYMGQLESPEEFVFFDVDQVSCEAAGIIFLYGELPDGKCLYDRLTEKTSLVLFVREPELKAHLNRATQDIDVQDYIDQLQNQIGNYPSAEGQVKFTWMSITGRKRTLIYDVVQGSLILNKELK